MKTPWGRLIKHGVGLTTILVIAGVGFIFFAIVGLAVLTAKILAFIK